MAGSPRKRARKAAAIAKETDTKDRSARLVADDPLFIQQAWGYYQETQSQAELSRRLGVNRRTVRKLIKEGFPEKGIQAFEARFLAVRERVTAREDKALEDSLLAGREALGSLVVTYRDVTRVLRSAAPHLLDRSARGEAARKQLSPEALGRVAAGLTKAVELNEKVNRKDEQGALDEILEASGDAAQALGSVLQLVGSIARARLPKAPDEFDDEDSGEDNEPGTEGG